MTAPTLEAKRAAPELLPCPFCGGAAQYVSDYDDRCNAVLECTTCGANVGANHYLNGIAAWNRRTAVPVAEGVALPPLPEPYGAIEVAPRVTESVYSAEQVRQAQRDAVEADRKTRAKKPAQSIGDDPEFEGLVGDVYNAGFYNESIEKSLNALIAYIAGRTAGVAQAWQPIETAPKDREIWVFNGEQARMKWSEGECWALWVWADELLQDADPSPDQPTHWTPLPAAPSPLPLQEEDK